MQASDCRVAPTARSETRDRESCGAIGSTPSIGRREQSLAGLPVAADALLPRRVIRALVQTPYLIPPLRLDGVGVEAIGDLAVGHPLIIGTRSDSTTRENPASCDMGPRGAQGFRSYGPTPHSLSRRLSLLTAGARPTLCSNPPPKSRRCGVIARWMIASSPPPAPLCAYRQSAAALCGGPLFRP